MYAPYAARVKTRGEKAYSAQHSFELNARKPRPYINRIIARAFAREEKEHNSKREKNPPSHLSLAFIVVATKRLDSTREQGVALCISLSREHPLRPMCTRNGTNGAQVRRRSMVLASRRDTNLIARPLRATRDLWRTSSLPSDSIEKK